MEKSVLSIIAERHKEWVYIVKAYGCNHSIAEDIVQEMYIKMNRIISKGTNVMYNEDEINFYYIIRTLKSIYIDYCRRSKIDPVKIGTQNRRAYEPEKILDADTGGRIYFQKNLKTYEPNETESEEAPDYEGVYKKISTELDKFYWFDKKVFDIINSGTSISDLSRKTTIPYYTLYNTYRKVYNHLKKYL